MPKKPPRMSSDTARQTLDTFLHTGKIPKEGEDYLRQAATIGMALGETRQGSKKIKGHHKVWSIKRAADGHVEISLPHAAEHRNMWPGT